MNPTTCQTARSCATSQRVWNWVERVGTTRCEISSSRGLREWGIGWDESDIGTAGVSVYERMRNSVCAFV